MIGWGRTNDSIPIDYWILQNSWGLSWGEGGYFNMKMNDCYINDYVSYAQPKLF